MKKVAFDLYEYFSDAIKNENDEKGKVDLFEVITHLINVVKEEKSKVLLNSLLQELDALSTPLAKEPVQHG